MNTEPQKTELSLLVIPDLETTPMHELSMANRMRIIFGWPVQRQVLPKRQTIERPPTLLLMLRCPDCDKTQHVRRELGDGERSEIELRCPECTNYQNTPK